MKLLVELEFFADGMDEEDIAEVHRTLASVLESGAESTCTDIKVLSIQSKEPDENPSGYVGELSDILGGGKLE
jgi:hypothetical protein